MKNGLNLVTVRGCHLIFRWCVALSSLLGYICFVYAFSDTPVILHFTVQPSHLTKGSVLELGEHT